MSQRLELACQYLVNILRLEAPIDTGNLMQNGIAYRQISENAFDILIGGEPAPYAVYTNSPRTDGKKNHNEGWVERAIKQAIPLMTSIMGGNELGVALENVMLEHAITAKMAIRATALSKKRRKR